MSEKVGQEHLTDLLVPVEFYLKYGVYLGTRFKNKYIDEYIFKVRKDGLVIFDIKKIDEKIKKAAKFLAKYNPEDIVVVGRREYSWKPITKFAEIIGAKAYPRRYPPGILTNPALPNFVRAKVLVVVDPLLDKNTVKDAYDTGLPILALVDSNNTTNMVDIIIPCNNKGRKSLALIFYLLTREYLKEKGVIKSNEEFNYAVEDFVYEI